LGNAKIKIDIDRDPKLNRSLQSNIVEIAVNIPTGFAASVIFYRERQDAPVHAIAAEVWQSDRGKVLMVQPMHCLGLSPAQVVMGNAHGEEIELWASRIRGVMVECEEMLLVELQQKLGLNLVDLWLGLLLGDTGCVVSRQVNCEVEFGVDFYDRAGIWIVELVK
jgi:hypothetical protein